MTHDASSSCKMSSEWNLFIVNEYSLCFVSIYFYFVYIAREESLPLFTVCLITWHFPGLAIYLYVHPFVYCNQLWIYSSLSPCDSVALTSNYCRKFVMELDNCEIHSTVLVIYTIWYIGYVLLKCSCKSAWQFSSRLKQDWTCLWNSCVTTSAIPSAIPSLVSLTKTKRMYYEEDGILILYSTSE